MSKVVLAASSGMGLVGISATGAYLMGIFDAKEQSLSNTFQKFKEEGNRHCLGSYFPGLNFPMNTKEKQNSASDGKLEAEFFPQISSSIQPKSCLVVNWDKENYPENKGRGNFRGLWSFIRGDRGFLMFTVAETNPTDTQLDFSGGIYFVKRVAKEGIIHKYKEVNKLSIQSGDFEKTFPDIGDGIEKDRFGTKYDNWGFIATKGNFKHICKSSEADKCKEDKLESKGWFRGRWEGTPMDKGQKTPADWSKEGNIGLPQLHKNMDNLQSVLGGVFQNLGGQWIEKSLGGSQIK